MKSLEDILGTIYHRIRRALEEHEIIDYESGTAIEVRFRFGPGTHIDIEKIEEPRTELKRVKDKGLAPPMVMLDESLDELPEWVVNALQECLENDGRINGSQILQLYPEDEPFEAVLNTLNEYLQEFGSGYKLVAPDKRSRLGASNYTCKLYEITPRTPDDVFLS